MTDPLCLYLLQSNEGLEFTPVRHAEATGSGAEGMWGNCSSISLWWTREIRLRAGSDGNRAGLNVCFLTATDQGRLDVGDTITARLCSPLLRPWTHTHLHIYSQRAGISYEEFFGHFLGYQAGNLSGSCHSLTQSGSQGIAGDRVTACTKKRKKKSARMLAHTCIHSLSSTH